MKILKVVGVILAGTLALVLIAPVFISKSFRIEKSITVEAPAEKAYGLIGELRAWEKWNYWIANNDTMELEYGTATSGPGASYRWSGADGGGTATILAAQQDESVELSLDFGEQRQATVLWTLQEADGKTQVTWTFSGGNERYFGRWSNVMIGLMMKTPMEESLAKIKELAEA